MDIQDLPRVSYTIAVEKGWWSKPRPLTDLMLLTVSEMSEAIEDYRKHCEPQELWYEVKDAQGRVLTSPTKIPGGKPCGIPSELADFVIRIADIAGCLKDPQGPLADQIPVDAEIFDASLIDQEPLKGTFTEGLFKMTTPVMKTLYEDENGVIRPMPNFCACLHKAVQMTFALAKQFGIDLLTAIDIKTDFNGHREIRHGNKRL